MQMVSMAVVIKVKQSVLQWTDLITCKKGNAIHRQDLSIDDNRDLCSILGSCFYP